MRTTAAIRADIRRIEVLPPRHRWVMRETLGELRSEHLRAWTRERDGMMTREFSKDQVGLHIMSRGPVVQRVVAVLTDGSWPRGPESWSVQVFSDENEIAVRLGCTQAETIRGAEADVLARCGGITETVRDAVIACREAIADYMLRHARAEAEAC